jgi:hypothetical protein
MKQSDTADSVCRYHHKLKVNRSKLYRATDRISYNRFPGMINKIIHRKAQLTATEALLLPSTIAGVVLETTASTKMKIPTENHMSPKKYTGVLIGLGVKFEKRYFPC